MADIAESEPPNQPPTGPESGNAGANEKQIPCFFRYFGVIVRIWGILTVAALSTGAWWLMTQRIDYPYTSWYTIYYIKRKLTRGPFALGYMMLNVTMNRNFTSKLTNARKTRSAAIAIGLLELLWFIEVCVFCRDNGGICCTCWRLCVWIDYWRKTIIYVLIAIPEFVIDKPALVPFLCGSLIILLAVLYLFKTCETCCGGNDERSSKRSSRAIQPTSEVKDTSKALINEEQPQ